MSDVVRFPCNLPYYKAPFAIAVFSEIVNGDWAGAKAIYDANPTEVSDTMGQMDKCWKQFVPPTAPPTGRDMPTRLKIGQNCAWNGISPEDHNWADHNLPTPENPDPARVRQQVNFYNGSPVNCQESISLASPSGYQFQCLVNPANPTVPDINGTLLTALPDVGAVNGRNGAADAYIATMPGVTPPPPLG